MWAYMEPMQKHVWYACGLDMGLQWKRATKTCCKIGVFVEKQGFTAEKGPFTSGDLALNWVDVTPFKSFLFFQKICSASSAAALKRKMTLCPQNIAKLKLQSLY